MKDIILTISRQYGSGGDEIAAELSNILSVPLYKKEDIVAIAKENGVEESVFEGLEEQPTSSLLYSLVIGIQNGGADGLPKPHGRESVFALQANLINTLAANGSGVFLGRCSDYILRNNEKAVNIFIHGSLDKRAEKVSDANQMKILQAFDYINKIDKRRRSFYNFYTNRSWGDIENYDLVVNTDKLTVEDAVKLILNYIELLKNG